MTFRNDFNENLNTYLKEIEKISKPLNPEEELSLWTLYNTTNNEPLKNKYRDQIINSNLRYVISIASKYRGRGLTLHELISEGNIGLCKAFDKFNVGEGVRFLTYATWWIKNSILSAIQTDNKVRHLDIEDVSELTSYENNDITRQKNYLTPDIETEKLDKIGDILDAMKLLPERERNIILDYYDFDGKGGKNLKTVAPRHNMCSERVRQIKNIAIVKLRNIINNNNYNKTINF